MNYAGIGSRQTPPDIIKIMEDIAKAALLRIRENVGEYPNKDIASEALKQMEDV